MKILIVGAGAVGMVYGRALALGGCEVTFFAREKYRKDLEWQSKTGFLFYLWNRKSGGVPAAERWTGFKVCTSLDEVSATNWDFVIIATSSTGLRGEWLEPFLKSLNPKSLLLTLQPGMHDVEYLSAKFPHARLVEGTIPIVSYFAPLKTEQFKEKGIALWTPSGGKVVLGKTSDHSESTSLALDKLKGAFDLGGLKTVLSREGKKSNLVPGTALNLFIAALRQSEWSFEKLKQNDNLNIACEAMNEIIPVLAKRNGVKVSPLIIQYLLRPWFFKLVIWASRFIVPFDFETYLELHFTKVGDQMKQGLLDMIEVAQAEQVPALKQLASL
ncbi:MAG: hypothetical protein KA715_10120 [Xanthomonadaceae bacterium]|nr:hypothetical protein [Xanthomonadaceae bacterium]